ncbi:MAG: hypothetical protein M3275_10305 [Thermoproteota archaeon]|nr:hypothetical protein [Thermoproteota archaeon]
MEIRRTSGGLQHSISFTIQCIDECTEGQTKDASGQCPADQKQAYYLFASGEAINQKMIHRQNVLRLFATRAAAGDQP